MLIRFRRLREPGWPGSAVMLQKSGRLMELTADRKVRVSFSEHLVTLLREVRQLSALGFKIPSKIVDLVNAGPFACFVLFWAVL